MPADAYFDTKLDEREYHADRGRLSASTLELVRRDPRLFRAWLEGFPGRSMTPEMRLGRYVHALVLEGEEEAARRFACVPTRKEAGQSDEDDKRMFTRKNADKEYLRDWQEANKGKTWIDPEQKPIAEAMYRAVFKHPEAKKLLGPGFAPEVTAFWDCPHTDEPMKRRFDGLRVDDGQIIELKTGASIDPTNKANQNRWIDAGYHRQAAVSHDAYYACTGRNASMAWIFVEATDTDPFVSVRWAECDSHIVTLGRDGLEPMPGHPDRIEGYVELIRRAQWLRKERNFKPQWVRQSTTYRLPGWIERAMEMNER